jgi:hypothetical protein
MHTVTVSDTIALRLWQAGQDPHLGCLMPGVWRGHFGEFGGHRLGNRIHCGPGTGVP